MHTKMTPEERARQKDREAVGVLEAKREEVDVASPHVAEQAETSSDNIASAVARLQELMATLPE